MRIDTIKNMSFTKLWTLVSLKLLTVKSFDLFLQGALLVVILLEHNCFLLLRRDSDNYYVSMLMEDYAIWGVGGVEFAAGVLVAWLGRGRRQLALSFWLTVTAAAGLIVIAFPFSQENPAVAELCQSVPIPELSSYPMVRTSAESTYRTVFLVATLALGALAKVSIWAHGFTFLDDNESQNGTYFYGILISIQLSLGLSGKEWLRASANSQDWWVPHLSICMLTIMFAVLFLIFPRITPKGDWEETEDDGFLPSLKRVLTNRTVILQIGALGFLNAAVFRFFHYDGLYVQARYHIDALRPDLRSSRLIGSIFRPIVIIFFIMIFRMRFSVRRCDGVKASTAARVGGVAALFAAALFVALATMDCGAGSMAGFDGTTYTSPSCSSPCNCNSEKHGFVPVCGLNSSQTYFSPCEAGCNSYENLNGFLVFHDCSCDSVGVTRGACALPGCNLVYTLYQVFVTLILAIGGAAMVMQGMSLLRAVQRVDKPIAMGVQLATVGLTSQLLGHLLYYTINSVTCAFFNADRCQFHNPSIYAMAVVSALFTALSALISALASVWKQDAPGLLQMEER